jgi:hypothetical protein
VPKNKGRKLTGSSRKRGTDGGLVQRYEQPVPLNEALPAFAYGIDGAELIQVNTDERKLILELHTHNERAGLIYDDRGRKIIVYKKTVEAGDDPTVLPGTVKVDIDPTDDAHSERTVWRVAGSGDDPDDINSYPPAETVNEDWDDFAQEYIRETILTIKEGATIPEVGDFYTDTDGTREIIDRKKGPLMIGGLSREIQIFTVLADLPSYRIFPSPGVSFPAVFQFLLPTAATTANVSDLNKHGVVYKLLGERMDNYPCMQLRIFTSGEPVLVDLPEKYSVETPGVGSAVFRIPNRCIHPGWIILNSSSGIIEIMDPSTPGTYNRNEILCMDVQSKIWRGKKYVTDIVFACEAGFTNTAAQSAVRIKKAILAESPDGGIKDLVYASRIIVDGANVDAVPGLEDGATIWGTGGGSPTSEVLEIDGYGTQVSDDQYTDLSIVKIVATEAPVTVRAGGRAQVIKLNIGTLPVDGDTLVISAETGGKYDTVTDFTYTFRTAVSAPNDIKVEATKAAVVSNIYDAINLTAATAGTKYGTGTTQCPLIDPGSAVKLNALDTSTYDLGSDDIRFTDAVKFDRVLEFGATFTLTATVITEGATGAILAKGLIGSGTTYHYNRRALANPNYKANIPPGLAAGPTEELSFASSVTSQKTAVYVMDPEISLTYEIWNGSSWQPGTGGPFGGDNLETVSGEDLAKVYLTDADNYDKVRFLITNSDTENSHMLRLWIEHT